MTCYTEFLKGKIKLAEFTGFDVEPWEINPLLSPHQRDIVIWAVRGGRRAVFAAFGLGKSFIQLEILRLITGRFDGRGLIICPLGVRQEFMKDAFKLNTGEDPAFSDGQRVELQRWMDQDLAKRFIEIEFIRSIDQAGETGLYLTNYETVRDGRIDPNAFLCASLDEASVLRSFGSKTYQTFLTLFDKVAYRFVATATPNPNRHKELIHYAGFLGVMDTGQALTRFFARNSEKANDLRLYPHKEGEFWFWVSSWAVYITRPSDLGYPDDGYDLPPLRVIYHEIPTDHEKAGFERDGQGLMFRDNAMGVTGASREKRDSIPQRIAKTAEIVGAEPDLHWLIWHDLEAERHAIEAAIPGVVSVYGSQDLDAREAAVMQFGDGRITKLSTKPVLCGSGCNFQRHCARAVFAGIGFKFNDFIQAIHRIYRFLQSREVVIHIVHTEAEREVLRDLQAKWTQHEETVQKMIEIIKKYGLGNIKMHDTLARSIGVERIEVSGEHFSVANADCVEEARRQPDNHAGLIISSVPFANHYEYTPSYNDFGHTDNNDHFWGQMDFLTPELLRILQPGRLACIHVKDRVMFGNVTGKGVPTISPFHAEAIFHFMRHGFDYLGMHIILTDVVRENNQTYRLGYTEMRKDGTKMGQGCPEYVLLFRKPQTDRSKSYADVPVVKTPEDYSLAKWQIDAHAFWRSSGNRMMTADELAALGPARLASAFTKMSLQDVYNYEFHVKIGEGLQERMALPSSFMALAPGSWSDQVWHDINRMRTLNGDQAKRAVEQHVCPLQFDIVDRLIDRYSNPDDLVYDPFGGLMTVPYRAILKGRRGQASELNKAYFLDGVHYLKAAEKERGMPSLFDFIDAPEAAE
ncbi:MAG: hypothetical protein Unbinned664contig1000_20 [Prokaryotic dsDNA virus sp.]|nr:MAG: hypothetical protein Unbinned664contig1000_20 [Prokaryotic dsDNA virus sp.]